jgi:peroxiredoxin
VDHGLAMGCGVAFRVPHPHRVALGRGGIHFAEPQGSATWFRPVPATFVFDRHGILRWSFVDLDLTCRAEPAEVVAAVQALKGT